MDHTEGHSCSTLMGEPPTRFEKKYCSTPQKIYSQWHTRSLVDLNEDKTDWQSQHHDDDADIGVTMPKCTLRVYQISFNARRKWERDTSQSSGRWSIDFATYTRTFSKALPYCGLISLTLRISQTRFLAVASRKFILSYYSEAEAFLHTTMRTCKHHLATTSPCVPVAFPG